MMKTVIYLLYLHMAQNIFHQLSAHLEAKLLFINDQCVLGQKNLQEHQLLFFYSYYFIFKKELYYLKMLFKFLYIIKSIVLDKCVYFLKTIFIKCILKDIINFLYI